MKKSKLIVTGGPTREWLDPVRFLSNPSSGKMGVALAHAGEPYFEEVVFIHGPIETQQFSVFENVRAVEIESTCQLLAAIEKELTSDCCLIMAAAPADFRPAEVASQKIKKSDDDLILHLVRNPDILKSVKNLILDKNWQKVTLCGFAAETENLATNAQKKLATKGLDLICLNNVADSEIGFQANYNEVTIFFKDGRIKKLDLATKDKIAAQIIAEIIGLKHV